ncbi:hypothetical protein L1987_61423 [Smallanthus sonchifolius]|uniref:Uncharacterized protein n=1 Tax=Smallanthus sonchifolius TaxID=185202 RepID=A0ACB9C7N6_9ASTR|nr:hypothetical protein L1987_61423 [Smallanthus sonchifolius]
MFDLILPIWIAPNPNLLLVSTIRLYGLFELCIVFGTFAIWIRYRLAMKAGAEVVRKVEIEEKCVSGLITSDFDEVRAVVTVDCNVGGNGNCNGNVGGTGEDDSDDSAHVFVSGRVEVSDCDPGDLGGVNVDQFKKEELGVENGGIRVDLLVLETNGTVHGIVKDYVNLENGSTVDPPVVLVTNAVVQGVNGHAEKVSGEQEVVVKCTEEVDNTKEIENVEAKADDIGPGLTFVPESTLNSIESSQVTVSELESAVKPSTPFTVSNTGYEVMVNGGMESVSNLIDKAECQITVDGSGKTSEDLEFQVTADGSESSGSPIEERDGQATVVGSGKPSEDLGSQVTADEPESCGSPIKERECKVTVNGSDSIGSLVDNQECPVSVDESEPSANHTKKVESNTIVMELNGKPEEHQELLVITSEVDVEVGPNHVCNGIKSENKKAEVAEVWSGVESREHPDSGLVLSEEADALANGQVAKSDRILEMGETQISGTEADGSSEKLLKVTESVEMEVNAEEMKEQVKVEDEIQEHPRVVIDNVQNELNLEDNIAESSNETGVSSETETNIETVIHENTPSQYGVSNCIDKPQEGLQHEASAVNVETTNTVESECNNSELLVEKDKDSLSNPDELTVVEQKVEVVSHLGTENRSAEAMDSGNGVKNVDFSDDDEKVAEVKDAEDVPHLVTEIRSAEGMDCGTGVENVVVSDDEEKETEVKDANVEFVHHIVPENRSVEDVDCETGVKNGDFPDKEKESEVNDSPVGDHSTSFSDTIVNRGAVIEFGSIGRHETTPSIQNEKVEDLNGIQSNEIPNSSVDGEVNDAIDVQNEEEEVLEYNFLIKIPRFEDDNFRDQIRSAQVLVDEKTHIRDSIRAEVHEKRARLRAHNDAYNAARMEETAARRLVRSKRQEIEAVQVVIDRWKNALSVEDIDARIFGVEHMIQHETLLLKDEKQFIREIKQLKSLRDQLALHMGTQEEIRQAIDTKDQNEERMKALRKELDSLKGKVAKAEAVLKTIETRYDEDNRKELELQAQFRAADEVRQKAYAHLNSLRKLSYDKNKNFRKFKEDLGSAKQFASREDKDALHRLCANQVETFMEQWNNDDEFRKEYVSRCNMIASRRQRAPDGGPLVPDDAASALPGSVNEKVDRSPVSIPGDVKHVSVALPVEQGKDVSSTEDNNYTSKSIENVSGQKNQNLKNKGVAKPTNSGTDDMAKEESELAENILTKEEIELARKAELRKEEIAAKLKEQRRLEEKAKAIEALERKKRNAEKAQLRAELRARKEAEQKEKEREKRLRKKEKKKTGGGGGDGSANGEEAASSDGSNEPTTKEIETANKKKTQKPPAHFFSKQLKPKPVPPPLINKNKKRWQQWAKIAVTVLCVMFLFVLANCGLFYDFKAPRFNIPF